MIKPANPRYRYKLSTPEPSCLDKEYLDQGMEAYRVETVKRWLKHCSADKEKELSRLKSQGSLQF